MCLLLRAGAAEYTFKKPSNSFKAPGEAAPPAGPSAKRPRLAATDTEPGRYLCVA